MYVDAQGQCPLSSFLAPYHVFKEGISLNLDFIDCWRKIHATLLGFYVADEGSELRSLYLYCTPTVQRYFANPMQY